LLPVSKDILISDGAPVRSLAASAKTALQTVAAGQASENLLDFDDEPASEEPTGLAATQVLQQPAAKNIMSGTSANPLDDLVSIFGSASLMSSSAVPITPAPPALDVFGGAPPLTATVAPSTSSANQQEDLLGLF
jgi:AP-1 complex subunit beta-1